MKKLLICLLAACVCLMFAACGADKQNELKTGEIAETGDAEDGMPGFFDTLEPVELIGADSTGKGAAGQLFGEYVAERVSEITGGKLTIDYHPNGELGGDADLIRQMQTNDIQLVVCQTAPMVSFIPEMAVFDLPMVFSKYDGDKIDAVLNGENDFSASLKESYNAAGLHLLGFLQNATYRLTTANKELNTLEDFAGLQIRTMENTNHMNFWKAIGAEPTPLAWAEVYISLQNGTIDAEENAADTCVGASFQEVQKYLACTNHILYCNQICISEEAWQSLDALYQEALLQAVEDAIDYMRPKLKEIDEESKETLVDGGMILIEYDDSFFDEIFSLEGVKELYSDIDGQVNGLAELLEAELRRNDL